MGVAVVLATFAMLTSDKDAAQQIATSSSQGTHLFIVVDDVEDQPDLSITEERCQWRSAITEVRHSNGGTCTLRDALHLAQNTNPETAVTLLLRPGRFVLAKPLPEVLGTVQLIGSVGRLPFSNAPLSPYVGYEEDTCTADSQRRLWEWDDADDAYINAGHRQPGQSSPIGTTIDGNGRFQLLRTSRNSSVHIQTIRLENGRAAGPHSAAASVPTDREAASDSSSGNGDSDARDWLGGAVCALGRLVLTNVAVRGSEAAYGGGLYTEGVVEIHDSQLEWNVARRCGGALYAAHGGKVKVFSSGITRNRDHCNRHTTATDDPHAMAQYALGGGNRANGPRLPGGSAGAMRTSDGIVGPGKRDGRRPIDVSGAVAEGPRLSSSPLMDGDGSLGRLAM
jgi:hypothetical protein